MPLQQLQFRPGVNRESTTLANEGGWFECDKIRFRSGYPEKIGGWQLLSASSYIGTARSLWNWVTLKQFNLMGVGTEKKFYIEYGGTYYDITPIRETATLTNPFTTNINSGTANIVIVADTNHGAITGDYVTFSGATTVGGLNLNSEFVITYIDSNSYSIVAPTNAVSAATGGGTVTAQYQLNNGTNVGTSQVGWGAGLWGGVITGPTQTQLNGAITDSDTTITVDSTVGFPATGLLAVGNELISYAGKTSLTFTGCVRGEFGTVASSHLDNTIVQNADGFRGWGQSISVTTNTQLRLWSQANFGQDLLFNPRSGGIYYWTPGVGSNPDLSVRGTVVNVGDTPTIANTILVSDSTRIVIAFGCNDYADPELDPLLIRWSAQESYTDWTPDVTNQAGSFRLSHGSEIVTAMQTRQEIVVWTDAALYSMQYLGPPYVWGFTLLADNLSIASPNATCTAAGVTYWMGVDKFYSYAGRVETLPCSLRQYVFGDINKGQHAQIFAGSNEGYSEIWWFYCSANSAVIDRYVIFNYLDRVWYYGTLGRSAWLDSPLRDYPMAATLDNRIVYHEYGVDNGETNPPSPITSYIQSSDFDIGDGHNYGFVWRMVPDITFDGSTTPSPLFPQVTFTMRPRQNPGSNYNVAPSPTVASSQSYGSQTVYNVQQFTQIVYTRVRGRQMAIRIGSNTLGTQWQLGVPRMDVRPDGRR